MYVVVRDSVVESFGIIAGRIGRNVLLVVTLSSTFFFFLFANLDFIRREG